MNMGERPSSLNVSSASSSKTFQTSRRKPSGRLCLVEPGSTGKGAAGPGVDIVFHIAEQVTNDEPR